MPHTAPTKDVLDSVEADICHLPQENEDVTRAEVYRALKQAKQPKQRNLTKALKELESEDNIVIIRADKGNCTVVMEKTDYRNQIQERTSIYQSAIRGAIQHQEKSLSYRKNSWTARNLGASTKQTTGSSASPNPHPRRFTVYLRFTKWNRSKWTIISLSRKAQKRVYH